MGMPFPPPASSAPSTTPSANTTSTAPSSTGAPTTNPTADPLNQLFGQLMTGMQQQQQAGGMRPPQANNSVPPEQRFQIQLEQLANMGFHDRSANIQGLMFVLTNSDQRVVKLFDVYKIACNLDRIINLLFPPFFLFIFHVDRTLQVLG